MVSFVGMTLLHHIAVVRGYARQHSVKTGSLQVACSRFNIRGVPLSLQLSSVVADPSTCAEYRFHDNVLVSSASVPTYAENRFHYNVPVSSAAVPTFTENRFHYNFQITNHR